MAWHRWTIHAAILLLTCTLHAREFAAIDQHVLNTPARVENDIETLARYLIEPARNDREKVRAIFGWIAANISYDTSIYSSDRTLLPAPLRAHHGTGNVLKDRTAVCDGYSTLMEGLCQAAGIKVVKITGHAKGVGYKVGDRFTGSSDHAWNAVWLEGRWQLLDPTWGSGYMGSKGEFVREFDNYFFLTPPEKLIYSHFPDDSRWQLLDTPVSLNEFEAYPFLKSHFYKQGLGLISHHQGRIDWTENTIIRLSNPKQARLMATLKRGSIELDESSTLIRYADQEAAIRLLPPEPGEYTLRIYVKGKEESGVYRMAMDYLIHSRSKASGSAFPVLKPAFDQHQLEMRSHTGVIHWTDKTIVRIGNPQKAGLIAQLLKGEQEIDDSRTFVQRAGDEVHLHFLPPAPGRYTLRIFARGRAETGLYSMAMDYTVISPKKSTISAFPQIYKPFTDRNARLIEPMNKYLPRGKQVFFDLIVPGAIELRVIQAGQLTPLTQTGKRFTGQVEIKAKKISIGALFKKGRNYSFVLEYESR